MTIEKAIEVLEINKECAESDCRGRCSICDKYIQHKDIMDSMKDYIYALSMGIEALKESLPELSKEDTANDTK